MRPILELDSIEMSIIVTGLAQPVKTALQVRDRNASAAGAVV